MATHMRTFSISLVLSAIAVLTGGCAQVPVAPPEGPTARVSFRVENTAIQHVYEAFLTDCFMPTDATERYVMAMTYNPHSIHLIGPTVLQRIGMPALSNYPPKSYAEAYVRAGRPIALRFRVSNGIRTNASKQIVYTFEPGKDYEILTVDNRTVGYDVVISEIVNAGGQVRTLPAKGVIFVPHCVS